MSLKAALEIGTESCVQGKELNLTFGCFGPWSGPFFLYMWCVSLLVYVSFADGNHFKKWDEWSMFLVSLHLTVLWLADQKIMWKTVYFQKIISGAVAFINFHHLNFTDCCKTHSFFRHNFQVKSQKCSNNLHF